MARILLCAFALCLVMYVAGKCVAQHQLNEYVLLLDGRICFVRAETAQSLVLDAVIYLNSNVRAMYPPALRPTTVKYTCDSNRCTFDRAIADIFRTHELEMLGVRMEVLVAAYGLQELDLSDLAGVAGYLVVHNDETVLYSKTHHHARNRACPKHVLASLMGSKLAKMSLRCFWAMDLRGGIGWRWASVLAFSRSYCISMECHLIKSRICRCAFAHFHMHMSISDGRSDNPSPVMLGGHLCNRFLHIVRPLE